MKIVDLNQRLVCGDIYSYAWLPTERMWANLLTKEKQIPEDLEDVLIRNSMNLQDMDVNEVRAFQTEVRMTNIHNRKLEEISECE